MLAPAPLGDEKQAEAVTPAAAPPVRPRVRWPARLAAALGRRWRLLGLTGALLALVAAGCALAWPHGRAWYHRRAARRELQRYHNPQAVRHLKACLQVWPADPEALLLAARAARRAGFYADAEHSLKQYQHARGIDEAGTLELLLLSAERNVDQVAAKCRQRVEQGSPDAPLILEALARGYLRQYRLGEARFCLDRWQELEPDNPQALYLRGQFHLDYEHAPDRATKSYRRLLQRDPENEEARLGLSIVLLQSKNFAEGAEQLEYLRHCQPDNLRVPVGLAECRYGLGDKVEALRLLDEVLSRQPQYAPALALRGRIAWEGGDAALAEPWLRQAVARDPTDHQARYNLSLCLHKNGKDEEAQEHERVLKQRDEDVKRFNEIVTREMGQRPSDPALHCALGQILLRSGHKEEGLRWLQSALRLDPEYAPARQALAEYHQQTVAGKQPQTP